MDQINVRHEILEDTQDPNAARLII